MDSVVIGNGGDKVGCRKEQVVHILPGKETTLKTTLGFFLLKLGKAEFAEK